MNHWAAYPFIRYVACLIMGIMAAMSTSILSPLMWQAVLVLSLGYLCWFLLRQYVPWFQTGQGLIGCLLLFAFGYAITIERQRAAQIERLPDEVSYWLVEAESDGEQTPKTVKVQAKIIARLEEGGWKRSGGRLMLYIKNQEPGKEPALASILLIKARLNTVPDPLNPAVFNFKEYMSAKGINYQAFVDADMIRVLDGAGHNDLKAWSGIIRDQASATLEKYLPGRQEADIVKAMVLGVRESLDDEIMQAYATAGVMHVLAVSGLHVGFIYAFLNLLFRYWRRDGYGRWLSFACVLLVLWSYAFITGLSPSVIRAAFMFSMLDLGLKMKRKNSIFNTLAVAAFALLVYNPYNLRAVGFQLSFLAVGGIVYMAPKINAWYKGNSKYIDKVWGIMAVSIAAQIATFPLGLYYFGQFPTYFFITNLLVVPAAGFILLLGFVLLLLSLLSSTLALAVGFLLNGVMRMINGFVLFSEKLPYSKLQGAIGEFQLFLLFGGIFSILLLLRFKTFPWAVASSFSCVLFMGSLLYHSSSLKEQGKMAVYHIPGYSALHIIEGGDEFFMADEDLPEERFRFQVQPHRRALGLVSGRKENEVGTDFKAALLKESNYNLLVWRGISLVTVHAPLTFSLPARAPVKVDYLLITHNAVNDLKELRKYFKPGMLLIDGSNKQYLLKRLQQQAEELNLLCHITAEKGAFVLEIRNNLW